MAHMSLLASSVIRPAQTFSFRPNSTRAGVRAPARRALVVRAEKDPEQAAKDAGKNIKEGVEGLVNKGKDKLDNLSDETQDAANRIDREGRKEAGKAEDSARGVAKKAEAKGKGLGDSIKDTLAGAADAIKQKASSFKKSVKD